MNREEAIETIKKALPLSDTLAEAFYILHPELRESEDERVRKELIEFIKSLLCNDAFDRYKLGSWITWLEKQKEQEIPLMNGDADLYFDEWNQQNFNPTKRQCFEEGMRYATRLLTEDSPMLEEFKKGLEQVILWGREGYKVSPDGTTKSLTQDEIDEVLNKQKEQKPLSTEENEINPEEVRLLDTTISFLKDFADKGYENAVECIDWLKSKRNGTACK